MSTVTANIDAQLLKLSAEQKLELIGRLWDSLADDELPGPTPAQIEELRRRRKLMQDDPSRAIPFEESMRRVRREVERRRAERGHNS
jgi:putative addiction module component (TIGR02574 family)